MRRVPRLLYRGNKSMNREAIGNKKLAEKISAYWNSRLALKWIQMS